MDQPERVFRQRIRLTPPAVKSLAASANAFEAIKETRGSPPAAATATAPDENPARAAGDYKVGKWRPPIEGRIKKGEVRNPRGRPRGSKNTATLAREELDRKIPVLIKGKKTNMSKRQISVRKQVDSATNGNSKSLELVLKLEGTFGASQAPSTSSTIDAGPLPSRDQAILDFMRARMKEQVTLEIAQAKADVSR